jgi:AcrR family transcriptional regulator
MTTTPRPRTSADESVEDDPLESAVRRAPFADSPHLGPRGQRTRQRIVEAALRVFDDSGYHQASIDRITKLAGCSRVSFYQYFAGKEDLFRHLAGQVARQLGASTDALSPVTADHAGWTALRGWVARHAEIHARYAAVFRAFPAAAASDQLVAGRSERVGERSVERFRSSVAVTDLPTRRLDGVISLVMESLPLAHDAASVAEAAAPQAFPKERVEDALTDVIHRALFGRVDDVNVHEPATPPPPTVEFGPRMLAAIEKVEPPPDLTDTRKRTRESLMGAGRRIFVQRGYHGTRVDDIADAAGMSHGVLYQYFDNTEQLADILTAQAMQRVGSVFATAPRQLVGASRAWLRRYNAAHAPDAALIRLWVDAALLDPELRRDCAAALDNGRRLMARLLQPRGFGDVDAEAIVMVTLVSAFGAVERDESSIDAAAFIIERGLLDG